MRRSEKEIVDRSAIDSIIHRAHICRLAMSSNDHPYIVPLCFGYQGNTLYFHCAREGTKLDILKNNNEVCFEFDIDHQMVESEKACGWGMKYRSVIGFGKAFLVDDPAVKRKAFDTIMQRYSDHPLEYTKKALGHSIIIKVDIERITGKQSGYQ